MPETRPRFVTTKEFVEALVAAGVLDDMHTVRRVVIDANAGETVRLYVERIGDERLMHIGLPWHGIEVREAAAP